MRSWIWICYSASASCRTSRRLSRVSINSQHFASRFLPSASVPCRRRRFVENKISFWCDSTTVLGCVALISIWSNLLNFTYEFAMLIRNVEVLCRGRGGIPFRIFSGRCRRGSQDDFDRAEWEAVTLGFDLVSVLIEFCIFEGGNLMRFEKGF